LFWRSYNRFTSIQGQKTLTFSHNIHCTPHFTHCLKEFDKGFTLSKPRLSEGLLYSDWSDGPICCDWSTTYSACQNRKANWLRIFLKTFKNSDMNNNDGVCLCKLDSSGDMSLSLFTQLFYPHCHFLPNCPITVKEGRDKYHTDQLSQHSFCTTTSTSRANRRKWIKTLWLTHGLSRFLQEVKLDDSFHAVQFIDSSDQFRDNNSIYRPL